jgi:glycosyltransferase involved in cell wall biosynthesis
MDQAPDHPAEKKMIDIVWIVPRVPWPPRCGASVANCALIQAVAKLGYRIHLVCFTERATDVQMLGATLELQTDLPVHKVSLFRWPFFLRHRWLRMAVMLIGELVSPHLPLSVRPFASECCQKFLREMIDQNPQALFLWDGLHPMAAVSTGKELNQKKPLRAQKHIYRAHNIESALWEGYARQAFFPLNLFIQRQVVRMRKFEGHCLRSVDAIACVNESDHLWLNTTIAPRPVSDVVPISVDAPLSLKNNRSGRLTRLKTTDANNRALSLLWLGGLDWWPNRQGIHWFMETIWSELLKQNKQFTLTLVGKKTEQLKFSNQPNVTAHGHASSLTDIFASTDAMIVPILSGSGIRVKALQALAHGVPCLGTRFGLSGIPQKGVWFCDDVQDWIETLLALTAEQCVQKGLAGFEMISREFSQKNASAKMQRLISRLDFETHEKSDNAGLAHQLL